jgi:hypothetical protein
VCAQFRHHKTPARVDLLPGSIRFRPRGGKAWAVYCKHLKLKSETLVGSSAAMNTQPFIMVSAALHRRCDVEHVSRFCTVDEEQSTHTL